jgi:hypothetical protein
VHGETEDSSKVLREGYDDDGEAGAGEKILGLL